MPAQGYPYKRLIVCCDGTWQASNQGNRSVPSNVAKLSRAIKAYGFEDQDDDEDEFGLPLEVDESQKVKIPQITYYDAGVGTGAFGEGLSENVCEAYNFLVNNFEIGDEIYIFGFSRGAFTARSLAGLVCNVGICRNDMMDQFWEMYKVYCTKPEDMKMEDTKWGKGSQGTDDPRDPSNEPIDAWRLGGGKDWLKNSNKTDIKIVGVFDTVGSLGWPDTDHGNFSQVASQKKYGFHDTTIHPQIKNAFHALALDEKRRPFSPTLWYLPEKQGKPDAPTTNLIQCWFPGVHINIGGGSGDGLKATSKREGDLESMANISFAWMVDRVREVSFLKFDFTAIFDIMDHYADGLQNLIERKANEHSFWRPKPEEIKVYRGWGVGPIVDSFSTQDYFSQFIAGSKVRMPGQYTRLETDEKTKEKKEVWLKPENTNEYIHPVTYHGTYWPGGPSQNLTKEHQLKYEPKALEGFKRVSALKAPKELGYTYWTKDVPERDTEHGILHYLGSWIHDNKKMIPACTVRIPEWVIPYEETFPFHSLERKLIYARPRLQRAVYYDALKELKRRNDPRYDEIMSLWQKYEDPRADQQERDQANAKLRPALVDLQSFGLSILSENDRKAYDGQKDLPELNKATDNCEAFLAELDRENYLSTKRPTQIVVGTGVQKLCDGTAEGAALIGD